MQRGQVPVTDNTQSCEPHAHLTALSWTDAGETSKLEEISTRVKSCRSCDRLVEWREQVALERRASFANDVYWGRAVPAFGDPQARLIVVGLAPAAHGANRTGRMFTGDRSGDWLYAALYRNGYANQPTSDSIDDGLCLKDAYVTSAVKCAPPANKPSVVERDECVNRFLSAELDALRFKRVILALGQFSWDVVCSVMKVDAKPKFAHGATCEVALQGQRSTMIVASFHPSQQNTFTKKLTEPMFDEIFQVATAFITKSASLH